MKSHAKQKQKGNSPEKDSRSIRKKIRGGKTGPKTSGRIRTDSFIEMESHKNGTGTIPLIERKTVISNLEPKVNPWAFYRYFLADGNELIWYKHLESILTIFCSHHNHKLFKKSDIKYKPDEYIYIIHGRILEKFKSVEYTNYYGFIENFAIVEFTSLKLKHWDNAVDDEKKILTCMFWYFFNIQDTDNDSMIFDNLSESIDDEDSYSRNEYSIMQFREGSGCSYQAITDRDIRIKKLFKTIHSMKISETMKILDGCQESYLKSFVSEAIKCYSKMNQNYMVTSLTMEDDFYPSEHYIVTYDHTFKFWGNSTLICSVLNENFGSKQYQDEENLINAHLNLLNAYGTAYPS